MVTPRLELVRALHDDDLVDGALGEATEDPGQEEVLLGGAEARRRTGREDDRRDPGHVDDAVTDSTTIGCSGCSVAGSPMVPISSTTSRPFVTLPTIA